MDAAHVRDPSTLAALAPGLPLEMRVGQMRSSQRLQGSWLMNLLRPSRLPESSRQYVRGDPVNMIDWKAYARTDQLLIREVRDEASAVTAVVVDVSDTMLWPQGMSFAAGLPTKAEVASRVALALVHMHLRAGDHVVMGVIHQAGLEPHGPDSWIRFRSPADAVNLFDHLQHGSFQPSVLLAAASNGWRPTGRFNTAWWIGDGLGSGNISEFLEGATCAVLLHVLSSLECDISWIKGSASYFDEWRESKEYQGDTLHASYAESLLRWRAQIESQVTRLGAAYGHVTDKTPITWLQRFVEIAASRGQV
jgi:hypothetical protein